METEKEINNEKELSGSDIREISDIIFLDSRRYDSSGGESV